MKGNFPQNTGKSSLRKYKEFEWRFWTGYIRYFHSFEWRFWTGYNRYFLVFQWRFWEAIFVIFFPENHDYSPSNQLQGILFYVIYCPYLFATPHTSKCSSTVKSDVPSSTTYQKIRLDGHTFFSKKAPILYAEIGLFKCGSVIENLKTPSDVTSKNGLLAA